jgi:uncharacterized protein YdaU (DUF1376 family)
MDDDSKKGKPPAYMRYVKDWLASPTRRLFSKAARSAYTDLLDTCWDSINMEADLGPNIPYDMEELRILADCTLDEWKEFGEKVVSNFKLYPGKEKEFRTNQKLMDQWIKMKDKRENQSIRGKKGAAARWQKT